MTNAARIARSNTTDPLGHVKWGRIDFVTEVELAARWLVFKSVPARPLSPRRTLRKVPILTIPVFDRFCYSNDRPPVFVIATNRGSELRFITPRMVAANGTTLEIIMREEHWKNIPVWESEYAPGGSR